jgi:hypothetical protein
MPGKKELTSHQQNQIVSQLLLLVKEGNLEQKLVRGVLTSIANKFNVTAQTVGNVWTWAHQSFADPTVGSFWASPLKKISSRKQKYDRDEAQ